PFQALIAPVSRHWDASVQKVAQRTQFSYITGDTEQSQCASHVARLRKGSAVIPSTGWQRHDRRSCAKFQKMLYSTPCGIRLFLELQRVMRSHQSAASLMQCPRWC